MYAGSHIPLLQSPPRNFISDVDQLVEQTDISVVLQRYGLELPEQSSGEYRMNCVFNDSCTDSQYGNLTVKLSDKANRIYCHTCGVRGNLLTLIYGLEKRQPPTGGRLRREEFRFAVNKLREIAEGEPAAPGKPVLTPSSNDSPPPVNVPLAEHDKEAARALADLCDDLVCDPAEMCPEAAKYVRQRPWLTPELMTKCGVGWIPGNGRSLFRQNYLVYTHRTQRSEAVSYSGRDLSFEENWSKWQRQGRPDGKKPNHHRFVSRFHRGVELYGGQQKLRRRNHVFISRYSPTMCNLHKPFESIIKADGYEPWPNLIKNLRLSCENDWLDNREARDHVIDPRRVQGFVAG